MFDCHVHGFRSPDSDSQYKDSLEHALQKNLDGIILTEHLDLLPGAKINFDFESYADEIRKINMKMPGEILIGIELGMADFSITELNYFIEQNDFDCVIGSVHYINNEDPYLPEFYENRDKHKAYSIYLEKYIELLPQYPSVNILGHFDYISRYCDRYEDKNIYYKEFSDYFDEIFKYIIQNEIALEINTSTYRQRGLKPANTLDTDIIRRYLELGGELITLGSDAHFPADVGYNFQYFTRMLYDCGFKYITHYKKRKPVPEKLKI